MKDLTLTVGAKGWTIDEVRSVRERALTGAATGAQRWSSDTFLVAELERGESTASRPGL